MEFISNDIFKAGVYGIKDTSTNKIIYVGSTKTSFSRRWGEHIYEHEKNTHYNIELDRIFTDGNYQFCILEICENMTASDILERERYWSYKYKTIEKGAGINCGGGKIQDITYKNVKLFEETDEVNKCKEYIYNNWLNKKIGKEERDKIADYISKHIKLKGKFMATIRALNFNVFRYADKSHWIIKENENYEKVS